MSILIKGMEMPTSCRACRFAGFGGRRCELNVCMFTGESQPTLSPERMSKCPLVSVPPHGRLIDADAVQDEWYRLNFDRKISDGTLAYWNYLLSNMPTIIEAEGGE